MKTPGIRVLLPPVVAEILESIEKYRSTKRWKVMQGSIYGIKTEQSTWSVGRFSTAVQQNHAPGIQLLFIHPYPQRTHILRLMGPKTLLHMAVGLF